MCRMRRLIVSLLAACLIASSFGIVAAGQDRSAQLAEADGLYEQAVRLHQAGQSERALPLAERALKIFEKLNGPRHPTVAATLSLLASLYEKKFDYAKAEQSYLLALTIYMGTIGQENPYFASAATGLAGFYMSTGEIEKAEILFGRALAVYEKVSGPESLDVAAALNNLALLYTTRDDLAKAIRVRERAFLIFFKVLGSEDVLVAVAAGNLATDYIATGEYAKAEPILQRALAIFEKKLGKEHEDVAMVLDTLAGAYMAMGAYAKAEAASQRALAIREKTLGPTHPDLATTLHNLVKLYLITNDPVRALSLQSRVSELEEFKIALYLAYGSEQQKQVFLNSQLGNSSQEVSLHTRVLPADTQAARLAMTCILRRKGRALDAMTDLIGTFRRRANPQDGVLFDRLIEARTQLANLLLSRTDLSASTQRQSEVNQLMSQNEMFESAISRRSAEFRTQTQPVTLERVQQAIPNDAALVELFIHRPSDAKTSKFEAARYVAYVLHSTGAPTFVDLGEAAVIDRYAAHFRQVLQKPGGTEAREAGRALDERVMRPVRRLLGGMRHILLSSDAALNLIPFGALVDESGKYLIENYSITYLTSGRDLLRLQAQPESRSAPVVVADPLYDLPATSRPEVSGIQPNQPSDKTSRRSLDFTLKSYRPLPGTAEEAKALAQLLPQGTQLLQQAQATEAALKRVNSPRILHIATHGFFLPDQPQLPPAGNTPGRGTLDRRNSSIPPTGQENPLLRSGLVLAGVKQGESGPGEDGVLTALEVAGLNLWGTKLVVLSACETALGDVQNGAGVYGLRRALVLAGSEAQVMSLWKVSDAGTRDLMIAYYTRLQKGEGRAEALRQVQLEMLHGQLLSSTSSGERETSDTGEKNAAKDYRHPYYWAAFIQSGDWRSIDGKEASTH